MSGSNRGGARPGAGRPSNAERHQEAIANFSDLAAAGLGQCYAKLRALADGGCERTEVTWAPAGTVTRKEPLRDADGSPILNRAGGPILVEVLAFPDKPADELVAVEKKVITLAPDFKALEYLANRPMGRPREEAQPDAEQLDLRAAWASARAAMAARKARPPDADGPPPQPPAEEVDDDDD